MLSCKAILDIAKRKKGIFVVDRNSYRAANLRSRLKKMAKDPDCPLRMIDMTQKHFTYTINEAP